MRTLYAMAQENEAADHEVEAAKLRHAAAIELLRAARWQANYWRLLNRPCVVLGAEIAEVADCVSGDVMHYTASYDGLIVSGSSPDEAYEEFDRLWVGRE